MVAPSGPGPQTLTQPSSLGEPGTQDPAGPQAPQAAQTVRARSPRLCPMQPAAAIRSQRQGWGRGWFTAASGPASGRRGEGSGALQDTPPACSLGPQLTRQPEAGELEGPREKAGICLLPRSPPDDHHSPDHWLNAPP